MSGEAQVNLELGIDPDGAITGLQKLADVLQEVIETAAKAGSTAALDSKVNRHVGAATKSFVNAQSNVTNPERAVKNQQEYNAVLERTAALLEKNKLLMKDLSILNGSTQVSREIDKRVNRRPSGSQTNGEMTADAAAESAYDAAAQRQAAYEAQRDALLAQRQTEREAKRKPSGTSSRRRNGQVDTYWAHQTPDPAAQDREADREAQASAQSRAQKIRQVQEDYVAGRYNAPETKALLKYFRAQQHGHRLDEPIPTSYSVKDGKNSYEIPFSQPRSGHEAQVQAIRNLLTETELSPEDAEKALGELRKKRRENILNGKVRAPILDTDVFDPRQTVEQQIKAQKGSLDYQYFSKRISNQLTSGKITGSDARSQQETLDKNIEYLVTQRRGDYERTQNNALTAAVRAQNQKKADADAAKDAAREKASAESIARDIESGTPAPDAGKGGGKGVGNGGGKGGGGGRGGARNAAAAGDNKDEGDGWDLSEQIRGRIENLRRSLLVNSGLSLSRQYVPLSSQNIRSQLDLQSALNNGLAGNSDYLRAFGDEGRSRLGLETAQRGSLIGGNYTSLFGANELSKQQKAISETEELATNAAYLKGTAALATLRQQQAVAEAEELRQDIGYTAASAKLVTLRQQASAAEANALAGDTEYAAATLQLATLRKATEAREADAQSSSQEYRSAALAASVALKNQAAASDQALAGSKEYKDALVDAAYQLKRRQAVELEANARPDVVNQDIANRIARGNLQATTRQGVLQGQNNPAAIAQQAQIAALERSIKIQTDLDAYQQRDIQAEAQLIITKQNYDKALAEQVNQMQGRSASGFQRVRHSFRNGRSGGIGQTAADEQTLGQYISDHATRTLSYAIPGLAIAASFTELRQSVQQAEEAQKALREVQAEFEGLGQGNQFAGYKQSIAQISNATGLAVGEVADLSLVMKGVYGNTAQAEIGLKNVANAAVAMGLSVHEAQQDLTAIQQSFGNGQAPQGKTIAAISNEALHLQDLFGVPAKEIIAGTADFAPIAAQAGLSMNLTQSIVAATAQRSGLNASTIGESLGKVLPTFTQNSAGLVQFFQGQPAGKTGQSFISDLTKGDQSSALIDLFKAFPKLNKAQQTELINNFFGGNPQSRAVLLSASQAVSAPDFLSKANSPAPADRTTQETDKQLSTLKGRFDQLRTAATNLGVALLNGGIGRALEDIAHIAADVVTFFATLNKTTFGLAGQIAGIAAAALALRAAMSGILGVKGAFTALTVLGGGKAAGAAGALRAASGAGGLAVGADVGAAFAATAAGSWMTSLRKFATSPLGIGAGLFAGGALVNSQAHGNVPLSMLGTAGEYAGVGALVGSAVPVVGTALGAFSGALLGAITAGIKESNNDHVAQVLRGFPSNIGGGTGPTPPAAGQAFVPTPNKKAVPTATSKGGYETLTPAEQADWANQIANSGGYDSKGNWIPSPNAAAAKASLPALQAAADADKKKQDQAAIVATLKMGASNPAVGAFLQAGQIGKQAQAANFIGVDFAATQSAFQAGSTSYKNVVQSAQKTVQAMQIAYTLAPTAQNAEALQQSFQQQAQLGDQLAASQESIAAAFLQQGNPTADLQKTQLLLKQASSTKDPTKQLGIAQSIIASYQQTLQDQANMATTSAQQIAILQKGLQIPPAVLAQVNAILKANGYSDAQIQAATNGGNIVGAQQTPIQIAQAALQTPQAQQALGQAQAFEDPAAIAAANIKYAQLAYNTYANNPAFGANSPQAIQAQADLTNAQNQATDAQNAINVAKAQYAQAQYSSIGDTVSAAKQAYAVTQQQYNAAHGQAAQLQALASEVAAEKGITTAINDVFTAQADLVAAIAESTGNPQQIIAAAATKAQTDLANAQRIAAADAAIAKQQGVGYNKNKDDQYVKAISQYYRDVANVAQTTVQSTISQGETMLFLGQETATQFIASLEAILPSVKGNITQTQAVLKEIRQVQNSTANLNFALPTTIVPTTLYQARSFEALAPRSISGGPTSVNVTINVNGGSAASVNNAVSKLTAAVGGPQRTGTTPPLLAG